MKKQVPYFILFLSSIVLIASSCSTTKSIPPNDQLYKGAKWKVEGKLDKDVLKDMKKMAKPAPNSTILGIPFKLMLYNALPEPKKQKGLLYKLKFKVGQKPVLMSQVYPDPVKLRISKYLFDYGYFRPELTHEIIKEEKKGYVRYTVKPNTRYVVGDIYYPVDSSHLTNIIKGTANNSLIRKGDPVDIKTLESERERIDERLRNRGYFFFNPDFILYRIDSLHQGKADIYFTIKDETPETSKDTWTIGNISIYGNYSQQRDSIITREKGEREKQFTVIDQQNRYRPEVYDRALLIREDSVYNKNLHYLSIERLMNLNTFKFVKFSFNPDTIGGKRILDTKLYITPQKRNSVRLEASANTKTGNFVGSELSVRLRNVNTFKGAEVLDLKVSGGFDIQFGGKKVQSPNAFTFRTDMAFYIPRIVPYFKVVTGRNSFIPRTAILVGAEYLQRPELYTLRSFKGSLEYNWKYKKTTEHSFRPIRIQSINPSNITPKFDSILAEDVALRASFEKQLIIGSQYQYQFNNTFRTNKRFTYWTKFNIGASGNLFSLFSRPAVDTPGAIRFFNLPVSQFVRLELDLRGYLNVSQKLTWVNRVIGGTAIAYGNSRIAPYNEQFFIGGSSSIRSFRIRTLGPGSYHTPEKEFQANESGDVKIETNTELRYDLSKYLKLAWFADAGNIWFIKDIPDKPGSKFTKDFIKDFAVGTGIGFRLDFSILLLRIDLAIPLRKPWLPQGQRWTFNEPGFMNGTWIGDNLLTNIAIGYPF